MLCDFCHKDEAVIHIQEITQDGNKTINLCPKCAMKNVAKMHPGLDHLEHVLENIMGMVQGKDAKVRLEQIFNSSPDEDLLPDEDIECPTCHKKLSDFLKKHELGCQCCASAFGEYMRTYIEKSLNTDLPPLQDAIAIQNKASSPADTRPFDSDMMRKDELKRLKRELDCAIKVEDYERAAKIRDLIAEFTPVSGVGTSPGASSSGASSSSDTTKE